MSAQLIANPNTPITLGTSVLRTVVAGFEQNLVAVGGLIKVFSTGQMDLTSYVPSSIAIGVVHGWSMFRFNDPHQATCPIFVRIQYESQNESGGLRLRVSVGTAHDGAGTLQGQFASGLLGNDSMTATQAGALSPTPLAIHGGTGRLAMVSAGLAGNLGAQLRDYFIFGIERTRDNTGNYTNVGFTVVCGATTQHIVCNPSAEPIPPREGRWHAIVPYRTGGSRFNNAYPMGVIQPFSGVAVSPLTIFGVGHNAEYNVGEIVQLTTSTGNSIFYRCLDLSAWNISLANLTTSKIGNERLLMRWD